MTNYDGAASLAIQEAQLVCPECGLKPGHGGDCVRCEGVRDREIEDVAYCNGENGYSHHEPVEFTPTGSVPDCPQCGARCP